MVIEKSYQPDLAVTPRVVRQCKDARKSNRIVPHFLPEIGLVGTANNTWELLKRRHKIANHTMRTHLWFSAVPVLLSSF